MNTITKSRVSRKQTPTTKMRKQRRITKQDLQVKDREARKKIGETLDMAAFMADFKCDTTSAAYWETES
jgi:hypothetical protein